MRIDLKIGARPPAFAFVEYNDPRDAEDAVRGRDGYALVATLYPRLFGLTAVSG